MAIRRNSSPRKDPNGKGKQPLSIIVASIVFVGVALSASAVIAVMFNQLTPPLAIAQQRVTPPLVPSGGSSEETTVTSATTSGEQGMKAILSGKEEVPPVDAKASGTAEFNVSSDGETVSFKVDVKDINKVTMAHIHQGKKGENGPIVVWLQNYPSASGQIKGILSQGEIISKYLVGPLHGKQISDLVKLMEDGNAYVNVHTEQNRNGEIRGQIFK